MVEVNRLISELKRVASKLSSDAEMRQDLVQEMYVHFMLQATEDPNRTLSWYVKGCEFHGRNFLRRGRSVDSPKRARGKVLMRIDPEQPGESDVCDSIESSSSVTDGTMYSEDVISQIEPHLSKRQQDILSRLMQGYGVRQVARELGISHVAVIKHRRKIAKIAASIMRVSHSEGAIKADDLDLEHQYSCECA